MFTAGKVCVSEFRLLLTGATGRGGTTVPWGTPPLYEGRGVPYPDVNGGGGVGAP